MRKAGRRLGGIATPPSHPNCSKSALKQLGNETAGLVMNSGYLATAGSRATYPIRERGLLLLLLIGGS